MRLPALAGPTVWCVIVAADFLAAVTTTRRPTWLTLTLTLAFFTVIAWRFFVPSLAISPSPASGITMALTAIAAVRGGWEHGPWADVVADPSLWIAAVLLVAATAAAIVSPFTGIREPTTGDMEFPLRAGRWRVVEGHDRVFNHHWPAPRQRGALDLVAIGRTGRSRRGLVGGGDDAYFAFGAAITAPCAGTVIRTYDGLPDGVTDEARPAGNNVIIDNGHEHILLAHMRTGSVAVEVGERVEIGQHLGEVGNSGNSTEPHLHIHAERDGRPLRIRFVDIDRTLSRGRIVAT